MLPFELRFAHGAEIGVLEVGMIAVDIFDIALRPVVEVRQPALMETFFPNVHVWRICWLLYLTLFFYYRNFMCYFIFLTFLRELGVLGFRV